VRARSSTSRPPPRGCIRTSTAWPTVGINGLTQQLSHELGGQNIRINATAPGPIDTEANRTTTPAEMVDDIVKGLPLSRMGTPQDIVEMCLFLLSDEASWITGQVFNVDGGQIFRS
jgi:3-oxoacyl-[acyl-carrier protein] reductase